MYRILVWCIYKVGCMVDLTPVQRKAVEFILSHIEKTGMPPTLREIASFFQWKAVGSAQDVVAALRKKGILMSPTPGKARQIVPAPEIFSGLFEPNFGISALSSSKNKTPAKKPLSSYVNYEKVLPGFEELFRVPLLGTVQAGLPLEAIEHHHEYTTFPEVSRRSLKGGSLFALTIEGYSMLNAGFLPGDTILVESIATAQDREIVVAKVQQTEVTVKRYAQKGSSLYRIAQNFLNPDILPPAFLMPENSDFEPIPFGTREEDKLIGVVRALYRKNVL